MPLLSSSYRPPWGFANGHLQSIVPALFRRVPLITKWRERLVTPDDDFLDLDWTRSGSDKVVVISHGLEGSSRDTCVQAMAHAFLRRGWEVVAWNCRGCSGEPNRRLRAYHSGSSDDLRTVVRHVLNAERFQAVGLVGFSLGGNITLKFLGEESALIDPRILGGVAFSVPCDLAASSSCLAAPKNRIYMARFIRSLRRKLREKAIRFPGKLDLQGLRNVRTFEEFDNRITAPLHGFADARDYWERASSRSFLPHVRVPTLLVNARNDPFLPEECFPVHEAEDNPHLFLEVPQSGGHVGFVTLSRRGEFWSEARAADFLRRPRVEGEVQKVKT